MSKVETVGILKPEKELLKAIYWVSSFLKFVHVNGKQIFMSGYWPIFF